MSDEHSDPYAGLQDRLAKTTDEARAEAVAKRHARGGRTARETSRTSPMAGLFQSTVSWRLPRSGRDERATRYMPRPQPTQLSRQWARLTAIFLVPSRAKQR